MRATLPPESAPCSHSLAWSLWQHGLRFWGKAHLCPQPRPCLKQAWGAQAKVVLSPEALAECRQLGVGVARWVKSPLKPLPVAYLLPSVLSTTPLTRLQILPRLFTGTVCAIPPRVTLAEPQVALPMPAALAGAHHLVPPLTKVSMIPVQVAPARVDGANITERSTA